MITLLPSATETLVVGMDWPEVIGKLSKATTQKLRLQNQLKDPNIRFIGFVREDRFRLSLKITRPNSFLPIVSGIIEPTSTGCLIFFTYKLFPMTRMYLTFWSLFSLFMGVFLAREFDNYFLVAGAATVVLLIFWVSWSNFNIQLKHTRQALQEVLS